MKDNLISKCQVYFSGKSVEFKSALDINEAAYILGKEAFHLLVLDMDYRPERMGAECTPGQFYPYSRFIRYAGGGYGPRC